MTRNLIWILIGGAVIWAGLSANISTDKLSTAAPRLADFLARMFPPDLSVWPETLKSLLETLRIAILGTFFSVILSAGLGMLASENCSPAWSGVPCALFLR